MKLPTPSDKVTFDQVHSATTSHGMSNDTIKKSKNLLDPNVKVKIEEGKSCILLNCNNILTNDHQIMFIKLRS